MRPLIQVRFASGETLAMFGAALVLIAAIALSAVALFFGPTVSTISEHNAPCESPAFGPPGGCLLPVPNER